MLSLGLAALCLWGTEAIAPPAPQSSGDGFWVTFFWLGTFGFACCALILAGRLFDSRDQIVVDHRGILWRRRSDDPIPWQAISGIEVKSTQSIPFLCLWLRDPEAYRASGPAGWSDRLNRLMGFGDVSLTTIGLDRSFDELVDAVSRHQPEIGT